MVSLQTFSFKYFLDDTSPFCGATDTPVCTFGDVRPGFQRFTSGVTLANLLTASTAAGYIPYIHVAEVG